MYFKNSSLNYIPTTFGGEPIIIGIYRFTTKVLEHFNRRFVSFIVIRIIYTLFSIYLIRKT
ncbi:hypothetical protein DQV23_03255 [Staphylococcus aureus]|nr:hypothetical protein A7U44_03475 [Staphylococcus aureus]AXG00049.1 hypothetical protein DU470_02990 [Staphylococcus aureus]AXG02740.1 hypothetical protein DU471_02870 [Staphylococcus aureus]MBG0908989.1 hypothetical protein [Staphylococcus aureus]MBG1091812.1 hypothetical protein [Staphylococcus aureus]